jgi:hypothetical protein
MRKALLALIVVFFLSISTITSVAEAQTSSPALATLRLIKVELKRGLVNTLHGYYGYLHVVVYYYQIMNDGDPQYNYFLYEVVVQSVPGKVAFNNAWEVTRIEACFQVYNSLIDYSPTTTSSGEVPSIGAGVKGFIGASIPLLWLGSLNWVTVRDLSDLGTNKACWHVLFNTWQDPPNAPSDSSYLMRFTFIVRAPSGYPVYVDAKFRISFQDWPLGAEVLIIPIQPVLYLDIHSSETVVNT